MLSRRYRRSISKGGKTGVVLGVSINHIYQLDKNWLQLITLYTSSLQFILLSAKLLIVQTTVKF